MMTDQEIAEVAASVLRTDLPAANLLRAEASSAEDYEGEPIIRIEAIFEHRPHDILRKSADLTHRIRSALLAKGEDRFISLLNVYRDTIEEPDEDVD